VIIVAGSAGCHNDQAGCVPRKEIQELRSSRGGGLPLVPPLLQAGKRRLPRLAQAGIAGEL
jgi:hypothetical protein